MRVIDVMDANPPVAIVPGNRGELLKLFTAHRVPGFSVVKEGTRKLAGVVTRADLLHNPEEHQTAILMNPNPLTMYAQAPLREAASLVARNRTPIMPVVSGSNDLLGVLSGHSFLRALGDNRGRVQTYLQGRVTPVHASTPARAAMKILDITGASALPVLDDDGRLIGIVTDGDVLRRASVTHSMTESIVGLAPDEDAWNREGLGGVQRRSHETSDLALPSATVARIMTKAVRSVGPLATVAEAAAIMVENQWNQLPVVDGTGRLIDLLTNLDLVEAVR